LDGTIARSIQIEGEVQGVYFREWAVKVAQELDIAGWIRNLQDGRVDVYAVGDEIAVERFIRRLREGSPASDVDKVTTEPAEVTKLHTFLRRQSETSGH
jgi:acylphosphatase